MRVPAPDMARNAVGLALQTGLLVGCAMGLTSCALFSRPEIVGPVDEVMFVAQPDQCALTAVSGLEGENFTALADRPLRGQLRVIWPGQEIMSGLVPDRLNAQVSDEGRIIRLSCG